MKRLLQVSFDTLICSLTTTLIWFILGILVDKTLISIFILTYPIQYISNCLKAIFGIGANISEKKGNTHDTLSGMIIGIIFSVFCFGFLLLNLNSYIKFMGINTSMVFVIYSVLQIFLQTLLSLVITKLYYEDKNILANKYSILFYTINLVCILSISLLSSNPFLIIVPTLICLSIFIIYIIIKSIENVKIKFNIGKWIKYNSVELVDHIFLGLGYLIGINIAFNYDESYILAMTFVALITDAQWDIVTNSIGVVAKIDISRNNYNHKDHLKNAYKLILIIIISIFVMLMLMSNYYDLVPKLILIFLSFHILDFVIFPIYTLQTAYLQLEYSTVKTNSNNLFARILRLILSFLKTPYCNVIAQLSSSLYQFITMNIIFKNIYKIEK